MQRLPEDLPPALDGWDQLSVALDGDEELEQLSRVDSGTGAESTRRYGGALPF